MKETRICLGCAKELPTTRAYFHYEGRTKDNCASRCKVCLGAKDYGVKEPNKVFESKEGHKFCAKCREELPHNLFNKCVGNKDGYYSSCKECYNEYNKERRSTAEEKGKRALYGRKYRVKYYSTEHGKKINSINCQRRKHRKKNALYFYDVGIWNETLEHFENSCAYCGNEEKLQQEHVIPLNKGGNYIKQNIIPACASCNGSKHDRDIEEWYFKQPFFEQKRIDKIFEWAGIGENAQQLSFF